MSNITIVQDLPLPKSNHPGARRKYAIPSLEVGDTLIVSADDMDHLKRLQRTLHSSIALYRKKFPNFSYAMRPINNDDGSVSLGLWRLADKDRSSASVTSISGRRRHTTT